MNGSFSNLTSKMARIHFSCPLCATNGNSIYSFGKLIMFVVLVLVFISVVILVTFSSVSNSLGASLSKSSNNAEDDINYGIVIDCGSSGSRVYVYHWPPHSGDPNDLLNVKQLKDAKGDVVVKKVSPGLSSFEKNPDDASDHIKKLLLYAEQYIPLEKRRETFLYVMATAGMRMLPESAQKAILDDLQTDIKAEFDFVAPENHFEVISGKQEGVYAWIAINYALDRFSHSVSSPDDEADVAVTQSSADGHQVIHNRKRTVGIIDMGGGSVQIAFEVTDPNQIKDIPSQLLSEVNLGCQDSDTEHKYRIYVTTFLGYGANSAIERYDEMLAQKSAVLGKGGTETYPLQDACLPNGLKLASTDKSGATHHHIGTGQFDQCLESIFPLLNKSVSCGKMPCSFNGVHQPQIDIQSRFYGFSEFWYSMEDVLRMGGNYNYKNFNTKAKEYCGTSWSKLEGWYKNHLYPKADDHRFRYQCFKSAWMTEVFHKGFGFPTSYSKLTSAQLVNGKDVGWTLGALIYRTRFLPLRDIEKEKEQLQGQTAMSFWQRSTRLLDTQFLFIMCFLVVLMAIILYMKHLQCCPRKTPLPHVPSMSYFMTEQDQMEQGVRTVKSQGFIL